MDHLTLLIHDQLMAERRAESRRHALAKQAQGSGVRAAGRRRASARVVILLRLVSRPRVAETSS